MRKPIIRTFSSDGMPPTQRDKAAVAEFYLKKWTTAYDMSRIASRFATGNQYRNRPLGRGYANRATDQGLIEYGHETEYGYPGMQGDPSEPYSPYDYSPPPPPSPRREKRRRAYAKSVNENRSENYLPTDYSPPRARRTSTPEAEFQEASAESRLLPPFTYFFAGNDELRAQRAHDESYPPQAQQHLSAMSPSPTPEGDGEADHVPGSYYPQSHNSPPPQAQLNVPSSGQRAYAESVEDDGSGHHDEDVDEGL